MPREEQLMISFLLSLLFTHLVTDFVLQTEEFVTQKNSLDRRIKVKALCWHWVILFIVSSITILTVMRIVNSGFAWVTWRLVTGYLLLSASHLAIDYGKSLLDQRNNSLAYFVLDQVLHLLAILGLVCFLYTGDFVTCFRHIIGYLVGSNKLSLLLNPLQKILFSSILLVVITKASNIFIKLLIKAGGFKVDDELQQPTGRYIGSLERVFTVLAVYFNAMPALIGFYGAKTAVRFKHTEDNQWAEYYLIGTSISVLIGVIAGALLKLFV